MELALDPTDPTPLWSQLAQVLRQLVASGRLPPGAPVPSVRVLARQLTLNPGTVAKALQALVAEGYLVVRRGEGTFVTPSPPQFSPAERRRALDRAAQLYATAARRLGAPLSQAQEALAQAWEILDKGGSHG